MNIFEATYIKQYVPNGQADLVTAKRLLGNLIDGSWLYSISWPNDSGWIGQAKKDVKSELEQAEKRLDELRRAEKILASIKTGE